MFRSISSEEFPPFGKFHLELLPVHDKPRDLAEVHLFTGVNGTGKTRLLAVLAAMLGNSEFLRKRLKANSKHTRFVVMPSEQIGTQQNRSVSYLATHGGANWEMQGNPVHMWCQSVPAFAYQGTAYVSDATIAVMAGVKQPDRGECLSFCRPQGHSQLLLQAITNLKLQAAMDSMNQSGQPITRSTGIVQSIESTLTQVTGRPFLFQVTSYPTPVLYVRWGNSDLPFDLLPDGLRSIIGWLVDSIVMMDAWLQGKGDITDTEAVFLLDEIESHLHPVWQRRVLPAFQRLFPKAQMFVATHSPFVISSLNHGWIHKLTMENGGTAKIAKPIPATLGDSYIYVLDEIMGLPEWYDPETEKLLAEFRAVRDRAFNGDQESKVQAFELARSLAGRSDELQFMMGKELSQMERRLGGSPASK